MAFSLLEGDTTGNRVEFPTCPIAYCRRTYRLDRRSGGCIARNGD
jgi:hypothetical protein